MGAENNSTTATTATEGTEAGATQGTQAQEQTENNNANSTAGNTGEKLFTQADLDAKIAERLARERKKYENAQAQAQAATQAEATTDEGGAAPVQQVEVDVTEDARQQAAAIIAQANQRLIQAIAQSEATKLNINPDYVADAVRLADLSNVKVNDDGTVDTKSITTALEAVLERMPVLKATTEAPAGGFKVGGQGGNNTQTNGWANGNAAKNSGDSKRWNKNRY